MDGWFVLFVTVVALAAAIGFSLVLVAYINFLPAGFAAGRRWIWVLATIPAAIVAIPCAAVFILAPVLDLMPVGTLARWLAIPALTIHLIAAVRFFLTHWRDNAKTGKQLAGGLSLMLLAVGLLYGIGPMFAERIVAGVK